MGRQNEGIGCTWPGRRAVSLFLCLPIDILILILILILIPKFDCSPRLRAINFQFHVTTTLLFFPLGFSRQTPQLDQTTFFFDDYYTSCIYKPLVFFLVTFRLRLGVRSSLTRYIILSHYLTLLDCSLDHLVESCCIWQGCAN